MEVNSSSFTSARLCGGANNNLLKDVPSEIIQNEEDVVTCSTEAETVNCPKLKSSNFLQRTLRSVLKIRRNSSANSYDMDSGISVPSSKEDCLSENEEKCDGVDSGIASEAGDRPPSSRLSSCTNFTGSSFGDRVPGICGLPNLGNTCYMNSVLQCIGHLDIVVEYFAMDKYRADVKQRRSLFKSRRLDNHAKGKLTDHLAELLKCLWRFDCPVNVCKSFKDAVLKYGEQYRGALQQDAQEFLLWLLNHLHEELCKNTGWSYSKSSLIKKKKLCTDEEVAARTLAIHAQQNKSFIRNIFQAQYKSSIICSNCNTCSSTFDPYLCISLSIPQKDVKPLYVTMLFSSGNKPPMKVGVSVPYSGSVRDLRRILSKSVDVSLEQLVIALVYEDGDHCSLHDESMIDAIPELDDCLFALEVPAPDAVKSLSEAPKKATSLHTKPSEAVVPLQNGCAVDGLAASFNQRMSLAKEENSTIVVVVTNVEVKGKRSRRFGLPITLRVSKDVSFKELQILIRREMELEIRNKINKEARNWKLVLGIRVIGGIIHSEYLRESDTHPMKQPTVERGITTNITAGPNHVSLVAEWEPESESWCLASFGLGSAKEDISVKQLEEEFCTMQSFSLKDCLELHTKEEELHYEDCWKCPNCKTDVDRTTKANQWKGKISADVEFPLHGLDMSSHVAKRSNAVEKKSLLSRTESHTAEPTPEDCVYDLFCVCNHIGPYITSGHYTANCKNSASGSWYCFDDTAVYEIEEEQVCTRSAYMLFYQKRSAVSKSASSYSLSSMCSHWSQFLSNTAILDSEAER